VPTVMCGQLISLKFSSTVWEYRGWLSAGWLSTVSSQNVALTLSPRSRSRSGPGGAVQEGGVRGPAAGQG
jgi:hypothetical protein